MNDPNFIFGLMIGAALLSGFIRGFAGFGGPMVLVPFVSLYFPPAIAIAIVMTIDLWAAVQLLPDARHHVSKRVVVPMIAGTIVAVPLGIMTLLAAEALIMKRVICIAIILASLVLLSGWQYRGVAGAKSWILAGVASGFTMGATSIAVIGALFLNAESRDAAMNRANFIVWVFVPNIMIIALLAVHQLNVKDHFTLIVSMSIPYLGGCIVGARLHKKVDQTRIRRWTLSLIILVASASLYSTVGISG